MLLLLRTNATALPAAQRGKTWVMNTIQKKAPTGKKSYSWWLNFFQTTLRDNWE